MPLQLSRAKEILAALRAVERPLARVDALVTLQSLQPGEALVALVAVVGLLSGVDPPVFLQVS